MTRCFFIGLLAVGWLGLAGCASTPAPDVPRAPASSPIADVEQELAQAEKALQESLNNQWQSERDLYQLRQNIRETALLLKTLKDHADAWDNELLTNRVSLLLLEDQANALRLRARQLAESTAAKPASPPTAKSTVPPQPAPTPAKPVAPESTNTAPAATATPPSPSAIKWIAEGNQALRRGDLASAEALFEKARSQDASLIGAQLGLAACAYQRDDLEEARRLVRAILKADAQQPQALGLRGMLNWKDGKLAPAQKDAELAVFMAPSDAQLRKFHGIILYSAQRAEDAVAEMRKALELDPADAESMMNLAIMLAQQPGADLAEVASLYDRAVKAGEPEEPQLKDLLNRAKE